MDITDALFYLLSAVALLAGWRVFRTDSMVRASFLLLISFIAVGLIMLLLAAPYLGYATIFMMAVEMTVMALFMVMFMMNPAGLNPMNMVHQQRWAKLAGWSLFLFMTATVFRSEFPELAVDRGKDEISALGAELLGSSMLVFETAGVALLAAMLASVILSSHRGRYGPCLETSVPPPLEPGGQPADYHKTPEFREQEKERKQQKERE